MVGNVLENNKWCMRVYFMQCLQVHQMKMKDRLHRVTGLDAYTLPPPAAQHKEQQVQKKVSNSVRMLVGQLGVH